MLSTMDEKFQSHVDKEKWEVGTEGEGGMCVCVVVGQGGMGEGRMLREEKNKEGGKVLCFFKFSVFIIMKRYRFRYFPR